MKGQDFKLKEPIKSIRWDGSGGVKPVMDASTGVMSIAMGRPGLNGTMIHYANETTNEFQFNRKL